MGPLAPLSVNKVFFNCLVTEHKKSLLSPRRPPQTLPLLLPVTPFLLVCAQILLACLFPYNLLSRSPSLPYFFSSLSTSSSPSSSTEQLLGPITLQEHSNLLHMCQRQTLLLKNSTGSVSALFCSFKGMIGYFWETRI